MTFHSELVLAHAADVVTRRIRRDAVRNVCALLDDAEQADLVLEILGLRPSEGRDPTAADASSSSVR